MTPAPVVGLVFVHGYWLDSDNRPIVCNISAIRRGRIYYRLADQQRATEFCTIDRWPIVCQSDPDAKHCQEEPGAKDVSPNS